MHERFLGNIGILLAVVVATTACQERNPCIRLGDDRQFGTNHLEKIRLVSDFVKEMELPIPLNEVAFAIGAAYAVSQVAGGQDGVPVNLCFRLGDKGTAEFRVLSTAGAPLAEWQSTRMFEMP